MPVLVGAAVFNGSSKEGVAFVVDLTERKRAEKAVREGERRYHEVQLELAHANRIATVGQLSASIAHEINEPLSGIATNAAACLRMLSADPPDINDAARTIHRTLRDAKRASEVITRLRSLFSKGSTTSELVDLNAATREVITLSLNELRRADVALKSELGDGLPLVTCNRVQIQQVIMNLLLNASEAMGGVYDRPRELVVRTENDQGAGVRLTVQDTGPGFETHSVDKLFEAFYTTKSGGMGMGLSISRSIIENHNTDVSGQRTMKGRGPRLHSPFRVSLMDKPLRREAPRPTGIDFRAFQLATQRVERCGTCSSDAQPHSPF